MRQRQSNVITLKTVCRKIASAITVSHNSHIGGSDVEPLVEFAEMVGVKIPKGLVEDPGAGHARQYKVGPVAELLSVMAPTAGVFFDRSAMITQESLDPFALPDPDAPLVPQSVTVAPEPVKDDLESLTEEHLLSGLKACGIIRNAAGTRVNKNMSKDELIYLAREHQAKDLPEVCYARNKEEIENKHPNRNPEPPARIVNMNKTQLKAKLNEYGVAYDPDAKKSELVASLQHTINTMPPPPPAPPSAPPAEGGE